MLGTLFTDFQSTVPVRYRQRRVAASVEAVRSGLRDCSVSSIVFAEPRLGSHIPVNLTGLSRSHGYLLRFVLAV